MNNARPRQGGAILFALLVGSLFGIAAYLSIAGGKRPTSPHPPGVAVQSTLAQAREALISRAAADDNRPGSLPCPDLLTDTPSLANAPGDGKADMLTRNQCPSHVGWLPWVTLGIPQPLDDRHGTLWYVIAPGLHDDDSAMPINSDKPTGLALNGSGEIAALLIAARAPLPGQKRPSRDPGDHIEGQWQNGTRLDYVRSANADNDAILPIARAELIAAVEQRIAHRIRHCLSAHARQVGRYPWPAPLTANQRQGQRDSLFGRIALTQPTDGIGGELAKAGADLATQMGALSRAPDAAEQLGALAQLAEFSIRAKNLFGSLTEVADELQILGNKATSSLNKLQSSVTNAAENDRISVSEGNTIQAQQTSAIIAVNTLNEALFRYGLDALPWLAAQQGTTNENSTDNARSALIKQLEQLQKAGQTFAAQHTAEPRPLQALLVPPALAIGAQASDTASLSSAISNHAKAVAQLASANIESGEQTLQAIVGKDKANEAIMAWQAKATTANRNKMNAALAALEETVARLASGLQNQAAITSSGEAAAWPIIWASAHCAFLQKGPGWWNDNAWAELFFYQISSPEHLAHGALHVAGEQNLPLLVISAGPPLTGQTRPNNAIEHYLEGRNADPSRNGEARNPSPFFAAPSSGEPINDRVAY